MQKNKAHNKEVLSLVKAFQKIDHSSVRSKVLSLVKTISNSSEEENASARYLFCTGRKSPQQNLSQTPK